MGEVAEHFGRSKGAVSGWRKSGCPGLDRSPFDLDVIDAWVQSRQRKTSPKVDADVELARWRRTRRLREELAYRRDKGRLVERARLDEMKARLGIAVCTRFLGLPQSIAPELVCTQTIGEAHSILDREIRGILHQLSLMDFPPEAEELVNQAVEVVVRAKKSGGKQSFTTEDNL